jgi:hypothetical protein
MKTAQWLAAAILSLSVGMAPALHAQAASAMAVPIAGTISGLPESVSFSGTAQLVVQEAMDNTPGSVPRLVVSIILNGVSGHGLTTGATYVLNGQTTLTRQFVATNVVEVTFPFSVRGSGPTASTGTAVASFSFHYNLGTGQIVSANASLAAPKLPPLN